MRKFSQGFTLIELMVALSVTSVLGILSIAGFTSYNQTQILQSATDDVVSMLNLAKSRALSQVNSEKCTAGALSGYRVEIAVPKNYRLYLRCVNSGGTSEDTPIDKTKTLPRDLDFKGSVGLVGKNFVFSVITGNMVMEADNPNDPTIVITGYGRNKLIRVNKLGGVSVE